MDRKEIIKRLGEHFGVKPKYLSVPSFAYEIRTENEVYTIDRNGNITTLDGETITMEEILIRPREEEVAIVGEINNEESDGLTSESETVELDELQVNPLKTIDGIEIKIAMEDYTANSIKNIINMLYGKQHLIAMAFQTEQYFIDEGFAEDLSKEKTDSLEDLEAAIDKLGRERCPGFRIDFEEKTFSFWLLGAEINPERISAFKDLCALITEYAKTLKRASFKEAQDDNPKYALRTWLIRVGMNGPDYKETRKTILKHMEGSGAFRRVGDDLEA